MLLWFVIAYWVISVGIGLWAATRVHNTKDFAIAGGFLFVMAHGPGAFSLDAYLKRLPEQKTVGEPIHSL